MNRVDKLISIGSKAFHPTAEVASCLMNGQNGGAFNDVQLLLNSKNGFTAFEAALVVFPSIESAGLCSLGAWNDSSGWRRLYVDCVSENVVFFAQDVFGVQFGVSDSAVHRFDPEVGELSLYSENIEGWASLLLANYEEDTGWPLAHEWQVANGPIPPTHRLLPRQPFVLGGDYVVENLKLVESRSAMENWGRLYKTIRDVPDGQSVSLSGWLID